MGRGGNNLIARIPKIFNTIGDGVVPLQTYPFLRAHGNFLIHALSEAFFHDVQILNAKNIAGTHYRAGVVELVHVFGCHGEMTRTFREHFFEQGCSTFGKIGL